jgi:hypothetical protein
MINKQTKPIESLDYLEFYQLSDSEITGSNPIALFKHVLKTRDERNYKLYTIVVNFPSDSKQINNPEFDRKYNDLRKDDNPEKIFSEYPEFVGKFSN